MFKSHNILMKNKKPQYRLGGELEIVSIYFEEWALYE
jgi:hypothetical protein